MPNNPNTEAPITSFTLNELIALSGEAQYREGLLNGCIAVNSSSQMQLFRFPCRIDAFIIGVGTEGEAKGSLNLHEYRLKKNSIFIFSPKNILQVKSEEYFKADVIVVSPDFLRRINIDTKNLLQLFLQRRSQVFLKLIEHPLCQPAAFFQHLDQ